MGFIDPMVLSNGMTAGLFEFSIGPVLWFMVVGLVATAAMAIGLSGVRLGRATRMRLPKLAHPQLATVGVSRAR